MIEDKNISFTKEVIGFLNIIYRVLNKKHELNSHLVIMSYINNIEGIFSKIDFKKNDFFYFYIDIIISKYIISKINNIIDNIDEQSNIFFYQNLLNTFNIFLIKLEKLNNKKIIIEISNINSNLINTIISDIQLVSNAIEIDLLDFNDYRNIIESKLDIEQNKINKLLNNIDSNQSADFIKEIAIMNNMSSELNNTKKIWLHLIDIISTNRIILRNDISFWMENIAKHIIIKDVTDDTKSNIPYDWKEFSDFDKIKIINKINKIESDASITLNAIFEEKDKL